MALSKGDIFLFLLYVGAVALLFFAQLQIIIAFIVIFIIISLLQKVLSDRENEKTRKRISEIENKIASIDTVLIKLEQRYEESRTNIQHLNRLFDEIEVLRNRIEEVGQDLREKSDKHYYELIGKIIEIENRISKVRSSINEQESF